MKSPDAPIAKKGFFVTHFLTVKDQARSKEFYVGILGGKVVKPENPCYIKLENSWIILNSGGGPTPDKPEVVLETPQNLNRVSSFLNLRVADVRDCYKKWSAKGAHFLTEPLDNHGHFLRAADTTQQRLAKHVAGAFRILQLFSCLVGFDQVG